MVSDGTITACVGMAFIGLIETALIITGQDGQYLVPVVAAISGLAGLKGGIDIGRKRQIKSR